MKMILPPLKKGDRGGFFGWILLNPPWPPFFKGGGILSTKFKNDTSVLSFG